MKKFILFWLSLYSSHLKQLTKTMKISFFIMFATTLTLLANTSDAQNAIINFGEEKVSVGQFINEIEEQTDFLVVYSNREIDITREVNLSKKENNVSSFLAEVFSNTGIDYEFDKNYIILAKEKIKTEYTREQQQNLVTGTVIDTKGEKLLGVNVTVKGTTIGALTDLEGRYSIAVPNASATLQFSFIGYVQQEVIAGDRKVIDVTLAEDVQLLEEVVVVGYGTVKKVNLTGAVSSVKFDEAISNRPITNASQALGGNMPGIWVSQNSGKPGSDGAQLMVRGWGTLNNSNPLVIIDGVEGLFEQINPNDIESISVLKDAASAAIYGSKAANGVILITTKTGRNNEKIEVSLHSYAGVQSLGMRYDLINNSAENMRLSNVGLANDGSTPVYPDYLISAFETSGDKFKYPNTDWYKELFKNALIHEHNISIQGGTGQSTSFLSFNYLNHDGMIPNTSSNRYGIRANLGTQINSWMKVNGNLNYNRRMSFEPYADITYGSLGRVFDMFHGAVPFIAPYAADGRFGSVQAIDNAGNLLYDNRNPLIDAFNGKTTNEVNYMTINASLDINLTKNLLLKTTIATNGNWNLTNRYNQSIFGYTDTGVETITKNFNREGIEINRRQISSIDNQLFTTLNYNKTFAKVHDVAAIGGIQLEHQKIENAYARRSLPPKEGLTQVDAGTSGIQGEGNMIGLRMFSYFGRVNYAFQNKYLVEANIRADASSRFAEGNRWGIFPGFSVGWRIIDEGFMKNQNLFSNLKIRASWGQLGNQNISGYWPYLTVISQSNILSYSSAGTLVPGAAVTALVDNDITWETTSTLDFGFDAGLLNNRINIEADYFKKKTSDIIVQLPIPSIMGGIAAPFENVGEMENNGFEFSISYDSRAKGRNEFGYNIGLNATYIDNKVTKFQKGAPDQTYLIREGYSYRTLYGFKAEGIYQTAQEASEHMFANSYKPKAGELKYTDVNGDGKLGFEDKQELGNTIPKLTFGLTSKFQFMGFDLNLLFQGIGMANMYTQDPLTNVSWENRNLNVMWRDAWTPDNTGTNIPAIRYNNTWNSQVSSFWVHDISFLKLKNLQLGYNLPENLLSSMGVQNIYFYVNAQNVFTIVSKDYDGWDPERNTFTSSSNMYPVPRIMSLGINLNF